MARRSNLKKLPRKRRIHDRSLPPAPANATVVSAVVQGTTTDVKYTFNTNVMFTGGVPAFTANSLAAVSVQATGVNFVTIRYAAAKAAAQPFVVPINDPSVRTSGGGWVAPTAGVLS